jgi:excisionase family DNA binding protein
VANPIDLDPRTRPVMTVTDAATVLCISRASAYEAVKAGEIPSIRLGRRIVVPTAALAQMLNLTEEPPDAAT